MDPNSLALLMGSAGGAAAAATYVEDVFQTWLYTGNGSTQTITNGVDLAGKDGLVWIKGRSNTFSAALIDTVRGGTSRLRSALTDAADTGGNLSFLSTGFELTDSNALTNGNGVTYVSWTFRKQAKFFDVVTYTGNATNRTIAHDLGSTPGCIIIKRTNAGGNWFVYHRGLSNPALDFINLNTTSAASTNFSAYWNSTAPTSTVFSLGTEADINANGGTYVAYLFAHDAGGFGDTGNDSIIKCGSYTGNASTSGPVVDLGWEPQWVLMKNANSSGSYWTMFDNMRGVVTNGTASDDARLMPHDSSVETLTNALSITSRGFQITNSSADYNENGSTHIYIAIRRGPMKTPTDATKVFKAVTQTSQGTVSTDFPVDMVIMGDRSSTWGYNWSVQDRLRGKSAVLFTSATTAENTTSLSTFDSNTSFKDGWISGGTSAIYETFRRAPGFFDVVAYTGTGSATTVNHNLGVAPELMIVKERSVSQHWGVYHKNLTSGGSAQRSGIYLSLTNGEFDVSTVWWNATAPTASVFSVATSNITNESSQTYIAYLFASCPGVSKVGSYTGTGTTLSVDCGFTAGARFVLIKRTDSTGDWYVWDTARGIVSGNDPYLLLNSTAAENTSTDYIDPLNAGFQISSTAPAAINANGGSFIYLAVA